MSVAFISAGEYAVYDTVLARANWDREAEYFGNTGINNCAIAAVNLAMWDAWGHTCRQPVWKMLGANRRRIPVYGSGGWISYTDQELLEEVLDYKKRGFKAVKIKVGSGSIKKTGCGTSGKVQGGAGGQCENHDGRQSGIQCAGCAGAGPQGFLPWEYSGLRSRWSTRTMPDTGF